MVANWVSWADDQEFVEAPNKVWHEINSDCEIKASWPTVKVFNEEEMSFNSEHVKDVAALLLKANKIK